MSFLLLIRIALTKAILFLILVSTSFFCKSQTRLDSIKNLTKYSKDYLQVLFNKMDVSLATTYWRDVVFEELKVGYNNGRIAYETKDDLIKLFLKDLKSLLKDIKKPITFCQSDSALLFDGDEGDKYFDINFDFNKDLNVDSDLKGTSLDFVSWDGGKSWKLNTDHWIGRFMYYLYRRNNR